MCVAQALKHLFCKCEALSSNPSPTIKKKKKKEGKFLSQQEGPMEASYFFFK
jgi:hypothetical protein